MARKHEHLEHHFTGSLVVRDAVLGMADGLTVPFALAAGLTGAIDTAWSAVEAQTRGTVTNFLASHARTGDAAADAAESCSEPGR